MRWLSITLLQKLFIKKIQGMQLTLTFHATLQVLQPKPMVLSRLCSPQIHAYYQKKVCGPCKEVHNNMMISCDQLEMH